MAALHSDVSLSWTDYVVASLMVLFILNEAIADNQLFDFQQQKHNKAPLDGKYSDSLKKGFMTEGLWKYVRHPNFFAEQAIWFTFYFFGVVASGQLTNWTLTGHVLLILLFAGSSQLTESISHGKYPDYRKYKQQVPRFIPNPFKSTH